MIFSHQGDAWDLYDSVRQALVDMYTDRCWFEKFEDEIRNQLNNPAHVFEHKIPDKGTLDLEKRRSKKATSASVDTYVPLLKEASSCSCREFFRRFLTVSFD